MIKTTLSSFAKSIGFNSQNYIPKVTKDCHRLLSRAGQLVVDSDDDPDYGIAVDYDVKLGIFGR